VCAKGIDLEALRDQTMVNQLSIAALTYGLSLDKDAKWDAGIYRWKGRVLMRIEQHNDHYSVDNEITWVELEDGATNFLDGFYGLDHEFETSKHEWECLNSFSNCC
jgi:hypothetical protein